MADLHRAGRYARLADGVERVTGRPFLRAWLAALSGPVAAVNFRPVDQLVADADRRLRDVGGRAFEKLVGVVYEQRSRKRIGDVTFAAALREDHGRAEVRWMRCFFNKAPFSISASTS
jgi:hypothetical protein